MLNELSDNEGRDTTEEINEVNYKKASALLEEGKFEDALKLFTALSELEYKDSADMILETRYRQGDKAEEDGNLNAAFIAFRKLYFESDYKDSHERYLRVRYKTALGEVEEDPLGSLRKFRQLVREGYEDAEKGVVIAKEAIMRLTEEGSDDFFYFWEEEYKNHAGDSDYDYFLLSIHNYVVKDTAEFEMCPFAEMPFDSSISGYFETIGDFYDALRQSAFGDRCMDVCYDMVRLVGRWSGYLFYLELTSEGRLSFNIPIRSFPYGQYYYLLYDGVLSIYKYKDDSYAGDLFKISFISEDEVSVYSFVTREWYVLTRE